MLTCVYALAIGTGVLLGDTTHQLCALALVVVLVARQLLRRPTAGQSRLRSASSSATRDARPSPLR